MRRCLAAAFIVSLSVLGCAEDQFASKPDVANASATVFDHSVNEPAIDMSGVQQGLAGGPVQVMVLGTAHLGGMSELVPKAHLSLLIEKLESFAPDIIAVESQSGISCGILKEYRSIYGQTWDDYCWDPEYMLQSLGVSTDEALSQSYAYLSESTANPTPAQRRNMAAFFFASGWSDSATLQWMQLAEEERTAADGINEELKAWLDKRLSSSNETVSIAAELGARLGLKYLHPMDDHTADIVYHNAPEELWDIVGSVWQASREQNQSNEETRQQLLGSPEGLVKYFLSLNDESSQQSPVDLDFGAVAKRSDSNNLARRYLAWWQVRGLRMAANVVEATALNPNAKVLVLVGSSHKPYFENYLNQMHDFEIIPVEQVLGLD